MALPRKILNALKAGSYTPSNASKKAREAANKLQQERTRINTVAPAPPPQRDTFRSVKERMVQKKHAAYYGTPGYNPRESAQAVFGSDEYEEMRSALGYTHDQMRELASLAGKAHIAKIRTGDAGELEVYLKYDFLFYHL